MSLQRKFQYLRASVIFSFNFYRRPTINRLHHPDQRSDISIVPQLKVHTVIFQKPR